MVTIRDGQPTNFNGNNTMIYGTDQLVKYATVKIEVSASNSSLPATLKVTTRLRFLFLRFRERQVTSIGT